MALTLIANSGIQFYKFLLKIDPNAEGIKGIGFYEWIDTQAQRVTLEYARFLPDEEVWVSKRQLAEEGFVDENGKLLDNINLNVLQKLDEDSEIFTVNDIETPLEFFENRWMPLPYFESVGEGNMRFGPTNWCRIKLVPHNVQRKVKEYKAVLAFDTSTAKSNDDYESPLLYESPKTFQICSDLDLLLNYTNDKFNCGWVEEYLVDIVLKGRQNIPQEFPSLKYIAYYLYFVKYLSSLKDENKTKIFPAIDLYPQLPNQFVDVDLILDIGNSNTCGVLFESPQDKNNFEFTSVKKLNIQDLSAPEFSYEDPFSMQLAFHQCDFGEMGHQSMKFKWPSFVRVGSEAKRLIYQSTNKISPEGKELVTNHSSPKRYLWDYEESNFQWELIQLGDSNFSAPIWVEGISQQFSKDGTFTKSVDFGTTNNFSRKSLMTFVLIEILAHAMVQINSVEFRTKHGQATQARKLRRLLITCPTAMTQAEQIVLRRCAEEASIALSRYYSSTYDTEYDEQNEKNKVEIIPSIKDLKKNLTQLDTKKDWIYDEATCCQFVFLYAEISKRYLNNCEKYFGLYGKTRRDLYDYDQKSITIGSIDIGGGTTDLMICTYKYSDKGSAAVLTPVPLYWESFNYAGDDLLKEIVRQVIIEGRIDDEAFRGCSGVIENFARDKGIEHIERKLNTFFGIDNNNIDFIGRQYRRKFNTQISVPIAERYLDHAKNNERDTILTFDDLFPVYKPNNDLLTYFEKHFGFRFQDIRWKLSAKKINNIVETVFEPMIKQLCTLLHVKSCDFVLLAGRPTSLQKIGDLFLKFYPVSPDRIITLNDYRVGRWYPFQEGNGYFNDQKSLVAVGASIALMGGKLDKLQGFRINVETLKRELISTAEYFGTYDRNTKSLSKVFISPDENKCRFEIDSLPLMIGFKRLPAHSYPGRMIYLLDFDDHKIEERQKAKSGTDENLAQDIEYYKTNLKNRMPLRVQFSRQAREDRELLILESIEDRERETLPKSIFKLQVKTLDEDNGYWLDTGEFALKISVK